MNGKRVVLGGLDKNVDVRTVRYTARLHGFGYLSFASSTLLSVIPPALHHDIRPPLNLPSYVTLFIRSFSLSLLFLLLFLTLTYSLSLLFLLPSLSLSLPLRP
jgi:hypothetical protein